MTVADLFVKCLENEGVRYIFGVPGEENEDLLFPLESSSIQFVPTRHEQGAAIFTGDARLAARPSATMRSFCEGL